MKKKKKKGSNIYWAERQRAQLTVHTERRWRVGVAVNGGGANRTAHGTNTPTSNTKARRKIVSHPQLAGEWRDIHNRFPSSKSPLLLWTFWFLSAR